MGVIGYHPEAIWMGTYDKRLARGTNIAGDFLTRHMGISWDNYGISWNINIDGIPEEVNHFTGLYSWDSHGYTIWIYMTISWLGISLKRGYTKRCTQNFITARHGEDDPLDLSPHLIPFVGLVTNVTNSIIRSIIRKGFRRNVPVQIDRIVFFSPAIHDQQHVAVRLNKVYAYQHIIVFVYRCVWHSIETLSFAHTHSYQRLMHVCHCQHSGV